MNADLNRYEDPWTAEVYDFEVAAGEQRRTQDTSLWLTLAEETGGPVLELASGTGRIALPLARAGYEVVGLDISPNMLAVARCKVEQEPAEVRARLRFVEGNMSDFSLGEQFNLILIPYSSFQALLPRSEQRSCLECCRRCLRPGGHLAIDVFNLRMSSVVAPGGVDQTPQEYPGPHGAMIRESGHTDFNTANQSLVWHARYECAAPDGQVTVHQHLLELRYFFRFEMEWMLEACGFAVEALYGNFDRSPLAADSPEMIFVASKAE